MGSTGNGYVYGTFNQPTPIEGTFVGMRGRERLRPERRARVDPVQVLSLGRGIASTDQAGGESASTATSNSGGSSRAAPPVSTRVSIASLAPRLR